MLEGWVMAGVADEMSDEDRTAPFDPDERYIGGA